MEQKYNGWLVSESFLKRCFAVLGHGLVAQAIIAIPMWIIMAILMFSFMGKITEQLPSETQQPGDPVGSFQAALKKI